MDIYADPLWRRFFPLFENAVTSCGQVNRIVITCKQKWDDLVIIMADKEGIPDHNKQTIFLKQSGTNGGLVLFLSAEILALAGITIKETGTFGDGAWFELTVNGRCIPLFPCRLKSLIDPFLLPGALPNIRSTDSRSRKKIWRQGTVIMSRILFPYYAIESG